MKNIVYILFISFFGVIQAQNNCSKFYPTEKGKKLVIEHFNHKGKLSSIVHYTISDITQSGAETILTIDMELMDHKKDKLLTNTSFKAICKNGETLLDPESFISPNIFNQYRGMEYKIEGTDISIPNSLTVGQQLENSDIIMSINAGVMSINMNIKMTNRKVIGRENITTAAGTFDCYIITYENHMKMNLGVNKTMQAKQWIAQGIGMVQQETRKENGKLISKSILKNVN